MMGEIVNLKRYKKQVARTGDDKNAAAQRAKFGRTKSERQRDRQQEAKLNAVLDQHRMGRNEMSQDET